jgi:hypothetical protein
VDVDPVAYFTWHALDCLLEKRPCPIAANRANYCSQTGLTGIAKPYCAAVRGLVNRRDPVTTAGLFSVSGIELVEPDPTYFRVPTGYAIRDMRPPQYAAHAGTPPVVNDSKYVERSQSLQLVSDHAHQPFVQGIYCLEELFQARRFESDVNALQINGQIFGELRSATYALS